MENKTKTMAKTGVEEPVNRTPTKMEEVCFMEYNNNPKGNKTSDCVVRAISLATGKSWDDVYEDLVVIGRRLSLMPSSKECYEEYLGRYTLISPKVQKGKKRMTGEDFDKGTYILRQANHLTVIKQGALVDTWDCRKRCVYKYWVIKEGE